MVNKEFKWNTFFQTTLICMIVCGTIFFAVGMVPISRYPDGSINYDDRTGANIMSAVLLFGLTCGPTIGYLAGKYYEGDDFEGTLFN